LHQEHNSFPTRRSSDLKAVKHFVVFRVCRFSRNMFDNEIVFLLLKIVSKRKKQKKKKAIQSRRTGGKTKRKRNKSRRVAGQHSNSAKPPYLPCHYAVVFWLGGAVGVRLTFATFLFFFGYNDTKCNLSVFYLCRIAT